MNRFLVPLLGSFALLVSSALLAQEETAGVRDENEAGAVETATLEPDPSASAADLLAAGDRFAREKEYEKALESWAKGYLELLPDWRALSFLYPLKARFMDRESLREYMLEALEKEYPDEKFEADRLALSHFGFFERDLDLKGLVVDLYQEEVAGLYDPDTKGLYLIKAEEDPEKEPSLWEKIFGASDRFDPDEQKAVLSHEMAHALADQHFDLYSLSRSVEEDDDAVLAVSALIEGEATLVMMFDMVGEDPEEVLRTAAVMGDAFTTALGMFYWLGTGEAFRKAPLLLREALLFPYTRGLSFTGRLTAGGDWDAVNRAFRNPPASTEQIIHPEKYLPAGRDDPVSITFAKEWPLGEEWALVDENVLGEFATEVLLRPRVGKAASAATAAGWDGDRYRVYRRKETDPVETLLVWVSTWDSAEDAKEFAGTIAAHFRARAGDASAGEKEGEENGSMDLPEDLPEPEAAWKRDGFLSAVWIEGKDVFLGDRVPEPAFARVARWVREVETSPKKLGIREFEPEVSFPQEKEETGEEE